MFFRQSSAVRSLLIDEECILRRREGLQRAHVVLEIARKFAAKTSRSPHGLSERSKDEFDEEQSDKLDVRKVMMSEGKNNSAVSFDSSLRSL